MLALAGFGALAGLRFAQAQSKIWRIGYLAARSRSTPSRPDRGYDAFLQSMRELGYVEGKNLVIEWRFADGRYERVPALAADLATKRVDVVVTHFSAGVEAAQRAMGAVPIVSASMADPVASGFAKSLARPGGNVTGLTNITSEVTPKQVEFLKLLIPKLSRVAVFLNPANPAYTAVLKSAESSAATIRVRVVPVSARNSEEIAAGFNVIKREHINAVIVPADALFTFAFPQINELAMQQRLPVLTSNRQGALSGALISYGPDVLHQYRRSAVYVDKILKGAKPADLPIEQPEKFELVFNLKTAKALGVDIPQQFLARADEVIR